MPVSEPTFCRGAARVGSSSSGSLSTSFEAALGRPSDGPGYARDRRTAWLPARSRAVSAAALDLVSHPHVRHKEERPEAADLPAREEYYRPTRARELLRQAKRLQTKWRRFRTVTPWLLWAGMVAASWTAPEPWRNGTCLLFGGLILLILGCDWSVIPRRCHRLIEEAAALDAEHQARYGQLPDGEEP